MSTYISYSEIQNGDELFKKKWGSLFLEFKNNKGFWSSQYYFIYFSRRLAYVLSQVYLNSQLYLQGGLNIFFSALTLAFLIVYRPFKDHAVFYSNIVGEISITLVMIYTYCFLWELGDDVKQMLELAVIFTVLCGMLIQFVISIYIFGKALFAICKKIEKARALNFAKLGAKKCTQTLDIS